MVEGEWTILLTIYEPEKPDNLLDFVKELEKKIGATDPARTIFKCMVETIICCKNADKKTAAMVDMSSQSGKA